MVVREICLIGYKLADTLRRVRPREVLGCLWLILDDHRNLIDRAHAKTLWQIELLLLDGTLRLCICIIARAN